MIRIDPEFRAYIPALAEEERGQLELNIVADGCRDPLIVWGDILIDGHNRFEICTRLGLPFQTVQKDFADRDAALDWMDAHQLGRRNLTADARKLLLGRRYNRVKMTKAEAGAIGGASKDQNDTCLENTAAKLAKEHGVSEATVKRAGKFAEEVEQDPELKAAVEAGQPVSSVKKARAPEAEVAPIAETQAPVDDAETKERREIARMTPEAMVDEIVALRGNNTDLTAQASKLKDERDDLKAKLKEATSDDLGRALGNAQRRADTATGRMREYMAAAKRMEYRLNKAEARVKELESMEVHFG
jgi:hypothetical protein